VRPSTPSILADASRFSRRGRSQDPDIGTVLHSAGAVHGSVYFKMLDDAAFCAASTLEPDFFVLATSLTTYITRPVSPGPMRSIGRVVNNTKTQFIVEAIAYDGEEREVARGSGVIVRSKIRLTDVAHYNA
jgi:uncharacterized protein (TIGR00369 family)